MRKRSGGAHAVRAARTGAAAGWLALLCGAAHAYCGPAPCSARHDWQLVPMTMPHGLRMDAPWRGGPDEPWATDAYVQGRYGAGAGRTRYYGARIGLKQPAAWSGLPTGLALPAEPPATAVVLGAYTAGRLGAADTAWFVHARYQSPLDSAPGYGTGRRYTLAMGLRAADESEATLVLRLDALHGARETGAPGAAEPLSGQRVYLGPGLSYALGRGAQVHGLVQTALYQEAYATPPVPRYAGVIGLTLRY